LCADHLIKALLEEVEASKASRQEFDVNTLVNAKSFTFGEPGTTKRRAAQKKHFEIKKRKSAHQHLKFFGQVWRCPW